MQPSGYRHEMPNLSYTNNMKGWAPELCARLPDAYLWVEGYCLDALCALAVENQRAEVTQ